MDATIEQLKLLNDLSSARSKLMPYLAKCDGYLRGEQPLRFMTEAMRAEFGDKITELVLNWPELGTEAYESRLDVEGFRFEGSAESMGRELWDVWQANQLDTRAPMAHTDSIGLGVSAVIVGPPDSPDAPPLVTVESATDVAWLRDPRTGSVRAAAKWWTDPDRMEWATLYMTGVTTVLRRDGGWVVDQAIQHGIPRVPLVPLVNRPRIKYPDGRSEFDSVLPVADAANKIATDMMQSAEYHAMPRRWVFGMKASDFKDQQGNMLSPWRALKNHIWASSDPNVKAGQFEESSLSNFHETIKLLAQLAGQMLALPPEYLGFSTVNPPSADALRASESRLVKRVERKQAHLGEAWEDVMRLVLGFQRNESLLALGTTLETRWREASTPTVAQRADAVMKLATAKTPSGVAVLPLRQARRDLGYTEVQIAEMEAMDAEQSTELARVIADAGIGG